MFRSKGNEKGQGDGSAANKDVNVPLVLTQDGKEMDPKAVQAQERKRRKRRIMKIAVYIMFGIITIGVFTIWLFHKDPVEYIRFGTEFIFTVKLRSLEIRNYDGDGILYADLGRQLLASPYDHCWDDSFKEYEKNCLYWRKMARLHVSEKTNGTHSSCYTMNWEGLLAGFQAEDCFYLQNHIWYGYLPETTSAWPISGVHLQYTEYYPTYPKMQAGNLVPVWFGAQSVSIFVNPSFPFSVSWNVTDKRQFCIRSVNSPEADQEAETLLEYTVCHATSPKGIFSATSQFLQEMDSKSFDQSEVMKLSPQKPIYGLNGEEDVLPFINQITQNGSEWGLVELFQNWEKEIGDLSVNPVLVDQINNLIHAGETHGCYPIFPISPFFSYKSRGFQEGIKNGYFMMDNLNLATRMIVWRGQEGATLDVTNLEATDWFLNQLTKLIADNDIKALKLLHQDVPLDSTFQDANVTYLDYNRLFYQKLSFLNVTLITEMAAGFITTPVFTPIKMSFYGKPGSACMNLSIPYSLTLGLSGFPLIIAEMNVHNTTTQEMFMRWLQLAIFYPVLEIPNSPMLLSDGIRKFMDKALTLRNEVLLPYLNRVWKDQYPMPVVRSLWWSWPKDRQTLAVSDQFMVGDELLVAPVLCEGAKSRKVYLPEGRWERDGEEPVHGPKTIIVNTEDLNVVPYFLKK